MNIIICVNSCVMNADLEAYHTEDLVWNRLRLEREIFNSVMKQCAFSKPNGIYIAESFFNYSKTIFTNRLFLQNAPLCKFDAPLTQSNAPLKK